MAAIRVAPSTLVLGKYEAVVRDGDITVITIGDTADGALDDALATLASAKGKAATAALAVATEAPLV